MEIYAIMYRDVAYTNVNYNYKNMTLSPKQLAINYNAHARIFLEAANLASQHSNNKRHENPMAYDLFKGVIVGTNHSFAAELMLKAIIVFHSGSYPRKHKLNDLMNHPKCKDFKNKLINTFDSNKHVSYNKESYLKHLNLYIKSLNPQDPYDKKEIDHINKIKRDYFFKSFEYFLEMHSNHFVKMRYACEKTPPPLDITFTSFLNSSLRHELEIELLKL